MKFKKSAAAILSVMMALSMTSISAFAAPDAILNNPIQESTKDVSVNADVASSYTLVIPQSVTLEGSGSGTYSADFDVKVKGDIGTTKSVTVKTTAPTMTRKGSSDKTATVTAPKEKWSRDDALAETTSTYTVNADLTPGTWSGTMTFNCSLG